MMDLASQTLGGASPEKPFNVKTSEADTVFGAIPGLQSKTLRNLFLGQLKTVVISAAVARRGLKPLVDFLERHPEIPPQADILIVDGSAKDILDAPLSSKEIPGLTIRNFLMSTLKADMVYTLRLNQLIRGLRVDQHDAYMPVISYEPREKSYIINGISVFHQDRMVGELNPIETRMFGFLSGKVRNAYPSIAMDLKSTATFRDIKSNAKTRVIINGDRTKFIIKARAQGFLTDLTSGKANFSPEDIKAIEAHTEKEITRGMRRTMRRLQEMRSDILGLGELLRATKPKEWQHVNWQTEYPKAEVRIDFKFNIQRTGVFR